MVDFRRRGILGLFLKAPAVVAASEVAKAIPEPPAAPAPPIPAPPPVVFRQLPSGRSFIDASGMGSYMSRIMVTAHMSTTTVPFWRGEGEGEEIPEDEYAELEDDDEDDEEPRP